MTNATVTWYGRLLATVEGIEGTPESRTTLSIGAPYVTTTRLRVAATATGERHVVVTPVQAGVLLRIRMRLGPTGSVVAADTRALAQRLGLPEQEVTDLALLGLIRGRNYLDGAPRREYRLTREGHGVLRQLTT